MSITRRRFLQISGLTIAGIAVKPASTLFSNQPTNRTGKRWAMLVELRACLQKDRCTDCIDACHTLHNVPRFEQPKHEIKWIWTSPFEHVFPDQTHRFMRDEQRRQPVLVLCNHCENPPCVTVCPTKATFIREDGIVMMDYHRCIGCRYCMAACPYGARSFNWRDPRPALKKVNQTFPTRTKGVVEKCSFCEERLVKNLKPACVEACKEKGLYFGDLNNPDSELRKILEDRHVLVRKPELGTRPNIYYLV